VRGPADAPGQSGAHAVGVTSTPELDRHVANVLSLRDRVGVLSVYVGIDPAAEATARPPWEIELEAGLQRVRARARSDGQRAQWMALDACIHSLTPALATLADSAEHGRGRALFAGVESGETHTIHTQLPFVTETTFGAVPHVLPLLAADDGHPVGIVPVGRHRVRALELHLGALSTLAEIDVEPLVTDGAERKGPVAANPLRAQHVVAQRERYERHVEADHRRRLRHATTRLADLAGERAWELAVIAGDPRGTTLLRAALVRAGIQVGVVESDLDGYPSSRLLDELTPVIGSLRLTRDLELVVRARAAAASGGNGAVGVTDVVGVLAEGRVTHLLLAEGQPLAGAVGPRGELAPEGVVLPGLDASGLSPEPQFGDRVALRALDTGARVTVVGGEAAAALADAGGVAALLRW
jgi:hypothetical protein